VIAGVTIEEVETRNDGFVRKSSRFAPDVVVVVVVGAK
jgi:hypothetical protein